MIKPPSRIGDTWPEFVGNGLLLLLFLPVIVPLRIISLLLLAFDWLYSRARREPKPVIPEVVSDQNLGSEVIAKLYVAKAAMLVKDLVVKHDKPKGKYVLHSARLGKRAVTLSHDDYATYIEIDDVDSYEWNTAEAGNIDELFWVAISALKNGLYEARTRLGRRVYWTRSDELKVWIKVQRPGSSYNAIDFYDKPPEEVSQSFKRSVSGKA